jgi:hypothetical protein
MASSPDAVKIPTDITRECEESVEQVQLVADLLLLRDDIEPTAVEPVTSASDSYAKCRDTIVARTKGLAILVRDLTVQLRGARLPEVSRTLKGTVEAVIALTEAATHAAYTIGVADPRSKCAQPGLVDRYRFSRARYGITSACRKFSKDYGSLTEQQILQVSSQIASNLTVLTELSRTASDIAPDPMSQDQFRQCAKSISGATAALLSSIKAYAKSRQDKDREKCVIFTKPLLETINAVMAFGSLPEYSGLPANMSEQGKAAQSAILGGAMAVVSSCIRLFTCVASLVQTHEDPVQWQKMMQCCKAISDSTKLLSGALRENSITGSQRAPFFAVNFEE